MPSSIGSNHNLDAPMLLVIEEAGYKVTEHISNTLQGCMLRAIHQQTGQKVAIKTTNKILHENQMSLFKGNFVRVDEDIIKEASILSYLTNDNNCPDSIVKFVDLFQSVVDIFFVMNDGGLSLFDFVKRGHQLIESGKLDICEWHRVNKIIFTQMVESIDYIHKKQVAHFDVSLENYLINDIAIKCNEDGKIKFILDDTKHPVQVQLCDFGLAEYFAETDKKFLSNKFCGKINYKSPEMMSRNSFDPQKNDIWCLGVSFFMMIVGVHPWPKAVHSDPVFARIMNGEIHSVLDETNKLHYVDGVLIELFGAFFKYEQKRINMDKLKECTRKWSNSSIC